MAAIWNVERTQSTRFPVRIAIEQAGVPFACGRVVAGAGGRFCLRERD
jgi:hypothetical protein